MPGLRAATTSASSPRSSSRSPRSSSSIFLALLLFNVVALAIELSIVIIIALVGLISRVVFRRPWTVFAKSGDQQIEYPVVGYFNSGRRIDELAEPRSSSGAQLPPGHR